MPKDTYLDEVRSGKVGARWALRQLDDEMPDLGRVINVLRILGHEDEARMAEELQEGILQLRLKVQRLERGQMRADKLAYKMKLDYQRAQG